MQRINIAEGAVSHPRAPRLQDGAIEALVEAKLQSRFLFLSANVVNQPLLSFVHARLGALLPFVLAVNDWHWCTSDDPGVCQKDELPQFCVGEDCAWHLVPERSGRPATLDGTVAGNETFALLAYP